MAFYIVRRLYCRTFALSDIWGRATPLHLYLPFYPPDASLPLTRTLRFLYLKSVSVQWMAGHVFPALTTCEVKFPHHADIIQALQPVTMPSCSYFLYHSNDLHPLTQFHLPSLAELRVKSGQWNAWRGNPQLAALCPIVATRAKSLTDLRLDVECSGQLLVYMLGLVPALERLSLRLARPNALSTSFFQALIIRGPNAGGASDMVGPQSQTISPLCPSLRSLYLHCRKWLRGPDKNELIVVLADIVASRNPELYCQFDLVLSFDEALLSSWSIDSLVRKSQHSRKAGLILGISSPRGIIPVSKNLRPSGLVPLPFKEAEYLRLCRFDSRASFKFLFAHDHMELMVYDSHRPAPPPTPLPCALPLFHALRFLVVEDANPSFLAGYTFHKLERCMVVDSRNSFGASSSLFTETEMPVCTRVDIDDPRLLATFKLPLIHELALDFSDPKCNIIWEKRIAVNVNLSGLTLLHMKNWPFDGDLTPILRSLSFLETLIISCWRGVVSFKSFLPMDANGSSGLKRMSGEGKALALLCPRLQSVQIEGQDFSVEPEVIPILKNIVTFRAAYGSPLKEFTLINFWPPPGSQFELIGSNGSFTMKKVVLPELEEFKLDI